MSKHVWVVESSGGKHWRPSGGVHVPHAFFAKKIADFTANQLQKESPGLKWRVAKYARVGGGK
jgi:hypothetical protein